MRPMKRHLAALLFMPLVAMSAPAWGATNPNDNNAQLLEDARASLRKGDARTALIQLKKAVKDNPSNGEARFELGVLEFQLRDFVAAEKELIQARSNNYDIAKVNPVLATLYLAEGKYQQLIDSIEPCADNVECKGNVLALRARARLGLKDAKGAQADSQAALDVLPNGLTTRLTHALVLRANGDMAGAEKLVDAILAGTPKMPDALALKAELQRQHNDLPGAIESFRKALDVNPKNPTILLQLAMAQMADNQNDEAAKNIDQALTLVPNSPMGLYVKGVLQARTHKMKEAMETLRPVEATIAQIPRGTFLLALVFAANNELEQALKFATQFHNSMPDNLIGTKLLADIQFRQRSFDKVIATLSPVRDQLTNDAQALNLLGSAYLAEGQIKEANELLTEAVKAKPDDALSQTRLALLRSRQTGTRDEGIRELESLVQTNPDNQRIDLALLSTYIANGQYDKAIALADDMAKRTPNSPLPLEVRGSARLAKGDEAAARKDFEAALAKDPNFVPAAVYISELDMRNGDFDHARKLLDDLLKRNSADQRLMMARAQVETRAGHYADAVRFLEAAVNAHPDDATAQVQLLQTQVAAGDRERAIVTAGDLAQKNRKNPSIVDLAARSLLSLGERNRGLDLYRQLEADFPTSAPLHRQAGRIFNAVGQVDEAQAAFDRAIASDPKYMPAWIDRTMLELKKSGYDAAKVIAGKALAANPKDESAILLPADLMAAAGKTPEAEAAYRKTLAEAPSTSAFVRLYETMLRAGDQAKATALAHDWLKEHPNDALVRTALAQNEFSAGRANEAARQYEALLAQQPRNAALLNNLAWAYQQMGDSRALETAKRAYQLAPGVPSIIDTYATFLYRGGDTKRGAELQREAYTASPKDPQIAYHMAKVLADAKNPTEARNILKPFMDRNLKFDESNDARKLYTTLGGS